MCFSVAIRDRCAEGVEMEITLVEERAMILHEQLSMDQAEKWLQSILTYERGERG